MIAWKKEAWSWHLERPGRCVVLETQKNVMLSQNRHPLPPAPQCIPSSSSSLLSSSYSSSPSSSSLSSSSCHYRPLTGKICVSWHRALTACLYFLLPGICDGASGLHLSWHCVQRWLWHHRHGLWNSWGVFVKSLESIEIAGVFKQLVCLWSP